jgi:hypothetical protein
MNKKLLYLLLIISVLATTVGAAATPTTVSAAAPSAITKVTLLQADFMEEKGMIFKFKVEGTFKENQLKGNLRIGGKDIKLRCRYNKNKAIAQCTAPGGTAANYAGKYAVVSLSGFYFWVLVPKRKPGL